MIRLFQKINPELALRLGLGLTYIYSGQSLFYNPTLWYGFEPQWFHDAVTSIISFDMYLRLQGIFEFTLGLILIAWFVPRAAVKIASMLFVVHLSLILLFAGIDPITFRDIGLLSAAVALTVLIFRSHDMLDRSLSSDKLKV